MVYMFGALLCRTVTLLQHTYYGYWVNIPKSLPMCAKGHISAKKRPHTAPQAAPDTLPAARRPLASGPETGTVRAQEHTNNKDPRTKRTMKKTIIIASCAALAVLLGLGALLYFKDLEPPVVTLSPGSGPVGQGTEFTVEASDPSGLRAVVVSLHAAGASKVLASKDYEKPATARLTFTLDQTGAADGPVDIAISAVDGSIAQFGKGNAGETTFTVTLDTRKPRLGVLSTQHNINQGGAGCIAYTVNEPTSQSGVRVGDHFFPGYQLESGDYACLFALPYDMAPEDFAPRLEATDLAGNTRAQTFAFHIINRTFRSDTITIPDSFLDAKMIQYEADYPGAASNLEIYLKVNGEMRVRDRAALLELGQNSTPEPLWHGAFLRLPNAANRARFADARTYRYNGEIVDQQTHLGIDLASLKASPVPAANAGRIVRTGFNGIYGENVVIDHGMGLMTLYAHLSQIDVEVGDMVEKGQIIGRTGATGLAGGDHLHYGTYISGLAVQPIEWWDQHWINDNVKQRLGM